MIKEIIDILKKTKIQEFIKFCIVGAICTGIDAGVFYAIHNIVGYRIAMVSGFSLSIIVNYYLNIQWSFQTKPSIKNAIGIFSAHLFNIFIVRMFLMWIFVDTLLMSDSLAYIPTLIISMITNFLIIRIVVKKL